MMSPGFFNQFLQQKSASNPQGMFGQPAQQSPQQSRFLPQGSTMTSNGFSPFVTRQGQNGMPAQTMRATMARDPNSTDVGQAQRDYETYQTGDTRQALQQAQQRAAQPTQRPQPQVAGVKPVSGPGANWANNYLSGSKAGQGMMGSIGGGRMMGGAGGMLGMLSDRQSKQKIRELETELQKTYSALGGAETEKPELRSPDMSALDKAAGYRGVGSYGYEYKDPNAPGAAAGRQSGPMADELQSLPGVVNSGPDGMKRVDTGRLTMNNASAIGQHQREIEDLKKKLAAIDPNAVNDVPAAEYPTVGY